MNDEIKKALEESIDDWAALDKSKAEREKKDRKIISIFCSKNTKGDMNKIIELLECFDGMAGPDKEIVNDFKTNYPDKLNTKLLYDFLDLKDIYAEYLESGGEYND